ncbi:MAG TPA: hypothetical protein VHC43_01285 [Mycobacteriales bacterium]|nr:hypothetical protein [Mycobacteriales bacterium]
MSYTLYRVADPAADPRAGIRLGRYATFEAALAARDDDTARLFAVTGAGQVLVAHHQIVGPGTLGASTAHPVSTGLPRSGSPTDTEVSDARRWLAEIHNT